MTRWVACACLLIALGCVASLGCGQNTNSAFGVVGASIGGGAPAPPAQVVDTKKGEEEVADVKAKEPALAARKIIYTTDLRLSVQSFGAAADKLEELVEAAPGAFIARSEVAAASGSARSGQWTIRVPVERRQHLVAALMKLGDLQQGKRDSKDVTEEYFDVESRIKNKKIEEERLLEHLKRSTGNLQEILTVEREVTRVRGEVEQAQGRLHMLANLTALATVSVHIVERAANVSEKPVSFAATISQTFFGSFNGVVTVGKALILVVVAVFPWLVTLALFVGLPFWLARRWLGQFARGKAPGIAAATAGTNPGQAQ